MTHEQFQQRYRYNPATDGLGEGGFGKVFKAYDTHRDRWVAIKIAEVKAGLEQVRLKKEVDMVNKLPSHANIAYYEESYTFSSFAGEYDFGILQYYEAGNLQQLADKTQLSFSQKEAILTQLLEGIAFLHSHGIIHRDLKPANILMVNRSGEYIPKITDFGISKQLDINKSSVFSNSLAGAGTLSFASPEQLGDKTIRKNTDLWSFGVIAFWMLTGKLPFNTGGQTPTSETGRAELLRQITSGKIPSAIDTIDTRWQQIIKSCLVVDAEIRIHKADDCLALLSGKTPQPKNKTEAPQAPETEINPPTPPPVTPPQPDKGKNYTPYWLLAAAVVIIIVMLIVNSYNNAEKERQTEQQRTEQFERQQLEEQNAWNTASNINSKAAYEQYLREYPQGRYVEDARNKINEIDKKEEQNRQANYSQQSDLSEWNTSKNTNTKAAYEKYLRDYPQGRYAGDARIKINEIDNQQTQASQQDDLSAWNAAKNTNTKAIYEKYLRDYPQGRYVADARSKINEIDKQEEQNRQAQASQQTEQNTWNTAKNTNTKAAYEKYLRDYPQGKYVADARNKISEAERINANSTQGKPEIEWVNIPAGNFTMGSPASEPRRGIDETQHQVTLSTYSMSKFEVTFEQYDAFCDATGRSKPSDNGWGRGKRPVINVSWDDAKAFADWMGCRLPTEAEWEYAARAGTTTPFSTGNCLSSTQANFDGNRDYNGCSMNEYRQKTLPVGSFAANAYGLFEMHGNVWEWCNDWYGDYPLVAQTNPKGPDSATSRVFRGGSWNRYAFYCRSAHRNFTTSDYRNFNLGFRLVFTK